MLHFMGAGWIIESAVIKGDDVWEEWMIMKCKQKRNEKEMKMIEYQWNFFNKIQRYLQEIICNITCIQVSNNTNKFIKSEC